MPVFLFAGFLYTSAMRKTFYLIVFVIVFLLGLAFAVLNSQTVTLNYYFDNVAVSMSLAMILAILLGALAGILVSLILMLRLRREVARLRRSLQLAEKETVKLRSNQNKTLV